MSRQKLGWLAARLAGVALLAAGPAVQAAQSDARAWVQRMNEAVVARNYDGVFRQRFGEGVEVFRIVHRMQNGEMSERVVSTDGSGYEQKRKGSVWAQFHPDKRLVDVQTRNRSFGYFPTLNGLDEAAARHYDMVDAGPARLVGRDVQLINLTPRDALRYGYRFWLDKESALPLKFQRVTNDGRVLKEIAFISPPSLPASISDDELKVALDTRQYRWVSRDLRTPMYNPALKRAYVPQRQLLPAGYRSRIFNSPAQEASAPGPRARFIVSDGISWAEVFIEPAGPARAADGKPDSRPQGVSIESWSYTTHQLRLDDVLVTVVGELPLATARAIAEAVRPE